ncbi:MAG: hypothetical protein JSR83_06050 [Proteobacteria bacterium]|nr:hypothetical protein [Pseudomonadota bacterium]
MNDSALLSGLPLIHAVFSSHGLETLGAPAGPFAVADERKIVVYCSDSDSVEIHTMPAAEFELMQIFREKNAVFTTENRKIKCCLDGISALGSTYPEAGLRALLKLKQQEAITNE